MYASLSEGHAKLQGSCMVEEERRVIWSLGGGGLVEKVGAQSVLEAMLGVGGSQQEGCRVPGSEAVSSLVVERGIMSLSSLALRLSKPP